MEYLKLQLSFWCIAGCYAFQNYKRHT